MITPKDTKEEEEEGQEEEEKEEEELRHLSLCRGQAQQRQKRQKPVRSELLPTALCRPTKPDVW